MLKFRDKWFSEKDVKPMSLKEVLEMELRGHCIDSAELENRLNRVERMIVALADAVFSDVISPAAFVQAVAHGRWEEVGREPLAMTPGRAEEVSTESTAGAEPGETGAA